MRQFGGLRVHVADRSGRFIVGADVESSGPALIQPVAGVTDAQGLGGYDYRAIVALQGGTQDPRLLMRNGFPSAISARLGPPCVF